MCCLFDRFQDVVGEPLPHRRSIKFPNTQDQLFTTAHNKKLSKRFARHEVPIHPIHAVRDGTIFTTSYDKQFSLTRSATVKTGDVFVLRLAFCDEQVVFSLAHRCHA